MLLATLLFPLLSAASFITVANPLQPRATATTCSADNCYRALSNKYTATAASFSSTYTAQPTATIPAAFTSGCASNPSRVSSACTCLATEYGAPRPFRRIYGPTDGTSYTVYDWSINIRSDELIAGSYDEYRDRCRKICDYNGNACQTFSFAIARSGPQTFYLCYAYRAEYLFDASKLSSVGDYGKYQRNEVWQRYQN